MPFAFDPLDEEQKKKDEQADGEGAPEMTGGGQSFGEGGGQLKVAPTEKGTNRQGSGFVGLDKYMNANKGNNFGGEFTGKVQNTVDAGKNSLNQNADSFANASNQGTTRWNDVKDDATGIVNNAGDSTSKEDIDKVHNYAGAQYKGPENFLGTTYGTKAQADVQKSAQEAKAFGSEGGRFALLDHYFGRPTYNQGQKSLDNLLVQNAPGVAARAQSIGGQAKQLSSDAANKNTELDNLAASNKQATADTGAQTKDLVSKSLSGFSTGLQGRYDDYSRGIDNENASLRGDIEDDTLNNSTLERYGLRPGDALYGLNLNDYVQDPGAKASLGQIASDQDYAKYLALSQLSGEEPTELQAADRSKAGSGFDMGKLNVDSSRLKSDMATSKSNYDSAVAPIMAKYQTQINAFNSNAQPGPNKDARYLADQAAKRDAEIQKRDAEIAALSKQMGASRLVNDPTFANVGRR